MILNSRRPRAVVTTGPFPRSSLLTTERRSRPELDAPRRGLHASLVSSLSSSWESGCLSGGNEGRRVSFILFFLSSSLCCRPCTPTLKSFFPSRQLFWTSRFCFLLYNSPTFLSRVCQSNREHLLLQLLLFHVAAAATQLTSLSYSSLVPHTTNSV